MRLHSVVPVVLGLALLAGSVGCAQNSQGTVEHAEAEADEPSSSARAKPGQSVPKQKVEIISQLPDVVDEAMPGVVGLSTQRVVKRDFPPFFPGAPFGPDAPRRRVRGIGSGVIVDKKGTILTNHHVVQGADSSEIKLGEPVVAIGQPFGLSGTVTYGIVSAKGRQNVGLAEYEDFIQTDAAINPGNSGGALVNMEGQLIGINTAILSKTGGYQGIGFAIPSTMAKRVMTQLIEDGQVERGYLGVLAQTLTPELAEAFGVPKETEGVVITDVQQDSPAAEAGLQQGDVIVEVKGQAITTASDLRLVIAQTPPGKTVEMTVIRGGERRTVQVELGALRKAGGQQKVDQPGMLQGLVLGSIDEKTREEFDLPDNLEKGLVVQGVQPGSPASRTGLRPGDVLLEVNRKELTSIEQLTQAYKQAERRILLLVYRDGNRFYVPIPTAEPGR
ncbi:MAG: PDZ domain-containing protein [Bradymonadaceae bacterium]